MKQTIIILLAVVLMSAVTYQVLQTDATLTGEGTIDSPLKVDTSEIATQFDISGFVSAGAASFVNAGGKSGGQTIIGGTGTTDDLSLQTTSGVGASGADMHFLVGNNGATEAMTILNSGSIGMGTTSPTEVLNLQKDATSGCYVRLNAINGAAGVQMYRANGSVGAETAVANNDFIGLFGARGFDTNYNTYSSGYWAIRAAENWTASANGTYMVFATTPTGSTSAAIGITLESTGNVKFGATAQLKGYTVATLPTGTTGMTAYVTDATAPTYLGTLTGGGSVVCPVFYNGSAWKPY